MVEVLWAHEGNVFLGLLGLGLVTAVSQLYMSYRDRDIARRSYEVFHSSFIEQSALASLSQRQSSLKYWEELGRRACTNAMLRDAKCQNLMGELSEQQHRVNQGEPLQSTMAQVAGHWLRRCCWGWWWWPVRNRYLAALEEREARTKHMLCLMESSRLLWTRLHKESSLQAERCRAAVEAERKRLAKAQHRMELWESFHTRELAWFWSGALPFLSTPLTIRLWRPKWATDVLLRQAGEDDSDFHFIEDIEGED